MRQSLEFAEDFSLGLVYLSEDGKRMTMIRYNGQHDQSNDPYDLAKPHPVSHSQGYARKPEQWAL